jgi:hypothetical protein
VKVRVVTTGAGPIDPVSTSQQRLNRRVVLAVRY